MIVKNIRIDRLEVLIVQQVNNSFDDELLTMINRLGRSSSIHTIHLQRYRTNSQLLTTDLLLMVHEICHNMSRLELMIIEFHQDALFNSQTLEILNDIQKKICQLDYIFVSNAYIELCFGR